MLLMTVDFPATLGPKRVRSMLAGCIVLTIMSVSEVTAFLTLIPVALYNYPVQQNCNRLTFHHHQAVDQTHQVKPGEQHTTCHKKNSHRPAQSFLPFKSAQKAKDTEGLTECAGDQQMDDGKRESLFHLLASAVHREAWFSHMTRACCN